MTLSPPALLASARRIVIKIGSALVVDENGARREWLDALAAEVRAALDAGQEILIVTSGAVALGRPALGISPKERSSTIPLERRQAAAAVGQFYLFAAWREAFSAHGVTAAQILLTTFETEDRRMHLNARATIGTLLAEKIVPIVNENDTVSTGELRYGDNDRLSARVAQMIGADLLLVLSTTDGLYTANPDLDKTAEHIPFVAAISGAHEAMAGDALAGPSTGGMRSKIEAAKLATRAGATMIITKGMAPGPLSALRSGQARATLFAAQDNSPQTARKRWIEGHVRPRGTLYIDSGAVQALESGRSLLPVGVRRVEGDFTRGDAVRIAEENSGKILGMGLCAYDCADAARIAGRKSGEISALLGFVGRDEMIHRDDMALLLREKPI